jgi:hypothetical protein
MALASAPAYAVTFAQYEQIDNTDTVSYNAGTLASAPGALVSFNYVDPMPAALDGPINALMSFSTTGAPYNGTITFLRQSDNANLLTVTFTNASLSGDGTAASFLDGTNVTFTSAFLDFSNADLENFSLGFSQLTDEFGSAAWTADSVGTFAAEGVEGPGGEVPEPATWLMMILGFGGAGAALRRRRATAFA